ncbi:hypothetical protein HWV07_12630 [Natronomonas salina]|uniref:hypothetical protein n=1 Tax=Natronomonas salina TaxID=1710540 RepID=UPI0015B5B75F|nr:hypothetical protein [Natronomonas salina]QLD89828.1 hypothetical protein HWV07_12630 [Natronomonas salina]
MASASSEPVGSEVRADGDRAAELEAELARERRRREAAEEWAEFLERELEAREQQLDGVIDQYETQLEGVQRDAEGGSGRLWARLAGWLRGR